MSTSLFGLEAELAVSGCLDGARVPASHVAGALIEAAKRTLVYLPGGNSRMYLGNGGLLYLDIGDKVEIATPECTTPWEAVSHLRNAERMVWELANQIRGEQGLSEVLVMRTNVDYLARTTWGAHESYLTRRPLRHFEPWIVPHLASRIIYTGNGGFDPLSPGIRFSLSPRIAFIDEVRSGDSTSARGLFHTREESLSRAYGRLHVLAGNNCCSQLQTVLQVGTTALIVALADSGLEKPPLKLIDAVSAARGFARNINHRAHTRQVRRTVLMTALELQYCYLERIEAHANTDILPEWAPQLCQLWRGALEVIGPEGGRGALSLDWTLKRDVFDREVNLGDLSWAQISVWSDVLEQLESQWPPHRNDPDETFLEPMASLRRHPAMRSHVDGAARILADHGLDWSGLDRFETLRRRLCEIDIRFSQVGDGIFDTLDARGLLPSHRMVGDEDIANARDNPPAHTRALARGTWVKNLASGTGRFRCDWGLIAGTGGYVDLSDPFATECTWTAGSTAENDFHFPESGHTRSSMRNLLETSLRQDNLREHALEQYCAGDFAGAEATLFELLARGYQPSSTHCHVARLCLITDRVAEAREHAENAWLHRDSAPSYVIARILWLQIAVTYLESHEFPVGSADTASSIALLLGKLKSLTQGGRASLPWTMVPVLHHLRSRLDRDEFVLLSTLIDALSDREYDALNALDSWNSATPIPLEETEAELTA